MSTESKEREKAEELINLTLNANGASDMAAIKNLSKQINWGKCGCKSLEERFTIAYNAKVNPYGYNGNKVQDNG